MISCKICGRQFAWKAQLAGKQVPCKCGAPLSIPLQDPSVNAPPPPEMHKIVIGCTVLVLVAMLGAYFAYLTLRDHKRQNNPATAAPPPLVYLPSDRKPLGFDAGVLKLDKEVGSAEVLKWLDEDHNRGVYGFFWTRELTAKEAALWYAHGAKNVVAFGNLWTPSLAIELPDDASKRKFFFDYADVFRHQTMGVNPTESAPKMPDDIFDKMRPPQIDVNQKYILLDFEYPRQPRKFVMP